MMLRDIVVIVFIMSGLIFMAVSAYGVMSFPDFFVRLHASAVGETIGAALIVIGMIIYTGIKILSLKIFVIFLFLMLVNPLGTNLIMIEAVNSRNYQGYRDKCRILEDEEKEE